MQYANLFGSFLKDLTFWERLRYASKRNWFAGFLAVPTNRSIAVDKIWLKIQEKKRKRKALN